MNALIPAQQGEKWEVDDIGLMLNKQEGHTFWMKDEIVQAQAIINGYEILVRKHSGRVSCEMYGVRVNGVVIVDGYNSPYLHREDVIDIVNSIRTPIGDYIDAEYDD